MSKDWKDPIHPGEILADELEEIGIKAVELSERIGVPNNRIYQILNGKRDITADTALRLGQFFWNMSRFLDESTKSLRIGRCTGEDRR
jgi:addiction module HigA family antidote